MEEGDNCSNGEKMTQSSGTDKDYIDFIKKQLSNVYDLKDEAPFIVMIERIDLKSCRKDERSVSELTFGRKCSEVFGDILGEAFDLKKPGKFKFSIKFVSATKANEFVKTFNSKILFDNQEWKAYVPNFKIYYSVILDVLDGDSTNCDDILKNLKAAPSDAPSWSPPVLAERMTASRKDDNGKYIKVKSNKYKLYFKSRNIPHRVSLHYKIFSLEPYVQKVKRCNICQRFGHVAIQCRNRNSPICAKCAKPGHSESACNQLDLIRCVNCIRHKIDDYFHKASDFRCPVFRWEKNTKILMARTGKNSPDCKKLLHENNGNIKVILSNLNNQVNNQANLEDFVIASNKRSYNFTKSKKPSKMRKVHPDHVTPSEKAEYPALPGDESESDFSDHEMEITPIQPTHSKSENASEKTDASKFHKDKNVYALQTDISTQTDLIEILAKVSIDNLVQTYGIKFQDQTQFDTLLHNVTKGITCSLKNRQTIPP